MVAACMLGLGHRTPRLRSGLASDAAFVRGGGPPAASVPFAEAGIPCRAVSGHIGALWCGLAGGLLPPPACALGIPPRPPGKRVVPKATLAMGTLLRAAGGRRSKPLSQFWLRRPAKAEGLRVTPACDRLCLGGARAGSLSGGGAPRRPPPRLRGPQLFSTRSSHCSGAVGSALWRRRPARDRRACASRRTRRGRSGLSRPRPLFSSRRPSASRPPLFCHVMAFWPAGSRCVPHLPCGKYRVKMYVPRPPASRNRSQSGPVGPSPPLSGRGTVRACPDSRGHALNRKHGVGGLGCGAHVLRAWSSWLCRVRCSGSEGGGGERGAALGHGRCVLRDVLSWCPLLSPAATRL
ncbi:unnamed protein product [Prorocentrum cordatum]|uniref:Uncharacterized protein n=1 Tax=Prorocentrum cordatum TaxID=2364126 RepID=A0ABN9S698_9DINO|nr:unnamed protein product [Polarella glacialis]